MIITDFHFSYLCSCSQHCRTESKSPKCETHIKALLIIVDSSSTMWRHYLMNSWPHMFCFLSCVKRFPELAVLQSLNLILMRGEAVTLEVKGSYQSQQKNVQMFFIKSSHLIVFLLLSTSEKTCCSLSLFNTMFSTAEVSYFVVQVT